MSPWKESRRFCQNSGSDRRCTRLPDRVHRRGIRLCRKSSHDGESGIVDTVLTGMDEQICSCPAPDSRRIILGAVVPISLLVAVYPEPAPKRVRILNLIYALAETRLVAEDARCARHRALRAGLRVNEATNVRGQLPADVLEHLDAALGPIDDNGVEDGHPLSQLLRLLDEALVRDDPVDDAHAESVAGIEALDHENDLI